MTVLSYIVCIQSDNIRLGAATGATRAQDLLRTRSLHGVAASAFALRPSRFGLRASASRLRVPTLNSRPGQLRRADSDSHNPDAAARGAREIYHTAPSNYKCRDGD